MRHSAYLYERLDGELTVHWQRGCPLRFGGEPEQLLELPPEHPAIAAIADAPPEVVLALLADVAGAALCVHCIPEVVLDRLGVEKPDGARSGTVLS